MFRAMLTVCFTLSTLFGQVMCCCAAPQSENAKHAEQTPVKRSCCSADTSNKLPSEPTKQSKHGDCPCNKGKQSLVAVQTEGPKTTVTAEWLASVLVEWVAILNPMIVLRNDQLLVHGSFQVSSHLSTDDLLYVHHRLRC
jgi:hypothetical protein